MKLVDCKYPFFAICTLILLYITTSSILGYSSKALTGLGVKPQTTYISHPDREQAIKDAFRHAWDGYLQYAYPDDALAPLSHSSKVTRSDWGVTVVDGLTTAMMMDMPDVVVTMLEHIETINFAETNGSVSLFGTTIRYLGSLLSAHDLFTSGQSQLDPNGEWAKILFDQSYSLVQALGFAFDTPSGIPQNNLKFLPKPTRKKTPTTDITAAGTLALEFSHFSKLTRSPWGEKAMSVLNQILAGSTPDTTPFPGLSARFIDIEEGHFRGAEGGWYGGTGGFYEYLLKAYILSPSQFQHSLDRWVLAADSSMTYLASHPSSRPDLTFLASFNGTEILYQTDHTAHFAGASFLLGGSVLREQKYIEFGLQLVDSQIEMYQATATGLGPDKYAWLPSFCHNLQGYIDDYNPDNSRYVPKACVIPLDYNNQSSFHEQAGFYSTLPKYILRPEVFESLYYAYRITGDVKYQDASWAIFQRILQYCKVDSGGFAGITDVNSIPDKVAAVASAGEKGGMDDLQYSFLLAETLKYAWLIQTDDHNKPWHVQADRKNAWIFNTEGHPLRIRNSIN